MFIKSIIQSFIVFTFLTIFFYTYVSSVEKEEYETQLNYIVDDLFTHYQPNIKPLFPTNPLKKDLVKTEIYGIIDYSKDYIEDSTSENNKSINERNETIIKQSVYIVALYFVICGIVVLGLSYYGYDINLKDNLKEGFFILIFIFIIEFTFLNMIAKHYLSGNANHVTSTISKSIIDYIDHRK